MEGGGRWGGGGKERGGRDIRMNHGAFAWGEFHFVTAYAILVLVLRTPDRFCVYGGFPFFIGMAGVGGARK